MTKDPVCGTDTAVTDQPKTNAKSDLSAVHRIEFHCDDILNLCRALDLIVYEIATESTQEPMTQRTRSALIGVNDALLRTATEARDFIDDNCSALRRELGNALSV